MCGACRMAKMCGRNLNAFSSYTDRGDGLGLDTIIVANV